MVVNNINDIIKLLKIYMLEHDKTQADIWKTLDIKQGNVSRTFSGKTNVGIQTIIDYINAVDGQLDINIIPKSTTDINVYNIVDTDNTDKTNKDN